jgi:hypothetical protein
MRLRKILPALLWSMLPLLAAHAAEDTPAPDSTAPGAVAANQMPALRIRWNCGDCPHNEKVIPLIEKEYAAEAARHKKSVATDRFADAEIVDFRQRNPGMRVMFGVMAGKDRLGLKITYEGRELPVEDYYANAVKGMNALCKSVAKIAYQQLIAARAGEPK